MRILVKKYEQAKPSITHYLINGGYIINDI